MLDYTVDHARTNELAQLRAALEAAYRQRGQTGQKDAVWNRCFRALTEAISKAVSEGLSVQVALRQPGEDYRQVTIRSVVRPSLDGMVVSEYRPAQGEHKRNPLLYPQKIEVYLPDIAGVEVRDERTNDQTVST
jgi:hypothetical protein